MVPRRCIYFLYFLLGAYAVCAQATLLRETQVVLFGSELSWGLVFAFWLAGVAMGAQLTRPLLRSRGRELRVFAAANITMPLLLVVAVLFLRGARSLLGTDSGEHIGLGNMLLVSAATTLPVSLWIGLAFPAAAAMLGETSERAAEKARTVGFVYLAEATGSLVGGVLFSFVFVTRLNVFIFAFGGGAVIAVATANLVYRHTRSMVFSIPVYLWAAASAWLVLTGSVLIRWRSFAHGIELMAWDDSKHQNIAVGRLADQYSLYTNGTVAATWPDHSAHAIEAHFAACQHPRPDRMLVLGGGVEGILKELLRHDPEYLDYVTLDHKEHELVTTHLGASDRAAIEDVRTQVHLTDARRFVKHAAQWVESSYDLVILAAPEPTSALLARLYTEEFFVELSRIMSANGTLVFSLTGSVGAWGPEVSEYVGSVVTPLERVFPEVLLTFGDPVRIVAANQTDSMTDSGALLAERYRTRNVNSPFFSPLWFEGGSDLLDAAKRTLVREAIATQPPRHYNSDMKPVASLYQLKLWLAAGGSTHSRGAGIVSSVLEIRLWWVFAAIFTCMLIGMLGALGRGGRGVRQAALMWSVGTTGFAAMAIEITLLYTLQILYGYVYGLVGLAIGIFMFGLVLGAALMNKYLGAQSPSQPPPQGFKILFALDISLAMFATTLPWVTGLLQAPALHDVAQMILFCLVGVTGVIGGLLFPLAAFVRLNDQASAAGAAAAVDTADHVGAAVGALVTGVVLVPVVGLAGTCLVVALMKVLSSLFVVGAVTVRLETEPLQ